MKKVALGGTGVEVSRMCLGTMMFGGRCSEAEADAVIARALERDVDFLDTAAMYEAGETESILGRILKGRRNRFFITTKVHKGVDGTAIETSIEESLRRMQTDHVDLYMIHWPQAGMHPEQMMRSLDAVVAAGKTRFVGFCNCPAWLFAHMNAIAAENGWTRLVCNQLPYNLIERGIEVEVLPQAVAEGTAITTYRALLAGLLAGKYHPGQPPPTDARGQTDPRIADWLSRYGEALAGLLAMAEERAVAPGHLATAWVYGQKGVSTPIVGVSSLAQLDSAIDGCELDLTDDERARLASLFGAEVKEEAGGNYPGLRRAYDLIAD